MKKYLRAIIFATITLTTMGVATIPALASLLITPLHILIEGRERSSQVVIVNTGDHTSTYKVGWHQSEQVEGLGGFVDIEKEEGKLYLQDFAVFSPRQFTLEPNEKQTVRIAVRRPADLPEGEYKTHLRMAAQARPTKNEIVKNNKAKFGAQINYAYSIPVVYRVGDYDAQIQLGTPTIETNQETQNLNIILPITRTGIHGALSNVLIYHKPTGGEEYLITRADGGSVYPEINSRNFKIPLNIKTLTPGQLRIVYVRAEGQKDEYVKMAEKTINIQN
ncbi:hypothetical protein N9Z27_02285 [Alphaproteobacteria bacterium]|nr:hypothetical protein [Alphaproteobacteria bacterium]